MVQKQKNKNGLIYYKINNEDQLKLILFRILGFSCDSCNKTIEKVYYIPVLNWGMCEECFQDWKNRAIKYAEDEWFEKQNVTWFEEQCKKCSVEVENTYVKV
ncbi:hypothetical protein [Clostridium sp.]|uniref:hypothetical protein n=1 Tax=Clostridium sp. TaxID=1506 RepID=UPI002900AA2A|nr:hypothetical protein [Clostridium sp.]MDU2156359.1 hypothetical protein [Clostridium sp.]